MQPAVSFRTDRAEIDFTKDGANHIVSLTPYLAHSDTVAVILECWNSNASSVASLNVSDAESGTGFPFQLAAGGLLHHAIRSAGPDHNANLAASSSDAHVAIVAELRGPGVVMHDDVVFVGPVSGPEVNTWINRSVTLEGADQAEDVELVLITGDTWSTEYGEWGVRALGSTSTKRWKCEEPNGIYFDPSATVDGDYQLYVEGKADPFRADITMYEIGYVKKGYGLVGVVDFADEGLSQAADWTAAALGSQVPDGAEGAFAVSHILGTGGTGHGLRAVGSGNGSGKVPSWSRFDSACAVALDDTKRLEYLAESNAPEFYVLAYSMVVPVSGSGVLTLSGQADLLSRVGLSGSATAKLIGSADLEILSLATQLQGAVAIRGVLGGKPAAAGALTAEPATASVLQAKPKIPEE